MDRSSGLVLWQDTDVCAVCAHLPARLVLLLVAAGQPHRTGTDHQVCVSHRLARLLHYPVDGGRVEHYTQDVRGDVGGAESGGVVTAFVALRQSCLRAVERWRRFGFGHCEGMRNGIQYVLDVYLNIFDKNVEKLIKLFLKNCGYFRISFYFYLFLLFFFEY